jgi:type IV pilus assembly protein PilB
LITASVNLVVAQRLARRNCADCKVDAPIDPQALIDLGCDPERAQNAKVMRGAGCQTCNNTGYKGRVALYEVMRFAEELKELVLQGASAAELKLGAIRSGMSTLRMSGINKILDGTTTLEEVGRVTMAD